MTIFQLTRSRGARLQTNEIQSLRDNFNSRAHVERDEMSEKLHKKYKYFNSRAHVERDWAK